MVMNKTFSKSANDVAGKSMARRECKTIARINVYCSEGKSMPLAQ